jgi:proline iminopeptidase
MIVDDIEKVRKALDLDKIAVLGHSMFGTLGLEYALKYPDNIYFSIVSGARPYTTEKYTTAVKEYWDLNASDERKQIHLKNLEKLAEENLDNLSDAEKFARIYIANIPKFFCDPHFDMSDVWEGARVNTAFTNHFNSVIMRNLDNTSMYHQIKSPVLVSAGRYDFWAPHFLWDDVKNIIPDCTFRLFENAGHNPMLEVTEEFDKVVIDWIESKK